MEPYEFADSFPQSVNLHGGWQSVAIDSGRRYEGCYAVFLESLFQNVLLEEQRSCQSATELHDRQFNLKENGGLQSIWQHRTGREKTFVWSTSPTHQHPLSWILCNILTDGLRRWYIKSIEVFHEVLILNLKGFHRSPVHLTVVFHPVRRSRCTVTSRWCDEAHLWHLWGSW